MFKAMDFRQEVFYAKTYLCIFLKKFFILLETIHDLCQLLGGGKGHPKIAMKVDFIYIN